MKTKKIAVFLTVLIAFAAFAIPASASTPYTGTQIQAWGETNLPLPLLVGPDSLQFSFKWQQFLINQDGLRNDFSYVGLRYKFTNDRWVAGYVGHAGAWTESGDDALNLSAWTQTNLGSSILVLGELDLYHYEDSTDHLGFLSGNYLLDDIWAIGTHVENIGSWLGDSTTIGPHIGALTRIGLLEIQYHRYVDGPKGQLVRFVVCKEF